MMTLALLLCPWGLPNTSSNDAADGAGQSAKPAAATAAAPAQAAARLGRALGASEFCGELRFWFNVRSQGAKADADTTQSYRIVVAPSGDVRLDSVGAGPVEDRWSVVIRADHIWFTRDGAAAVFVAPRVQPAGITEYEGEFSLLYANAAMATFFRDTLLGPIVTGVGDWQVVARPVLGDHEQRRTLALQSGNAVVRVAFAAPMEDAASEGPVDSIAFEATDSGAWRLYSFQREPVRIPKVVALSSLIGGESGMRDGCCTFIVTQSASADAAAPEFRSQLAAPAQFSPSWPGLAATCRLASDGRVQLSRW